MVRMRRGQGPASKQSPREAKVCAHVHLRAGEGSDAPLKSTKGYKAPKRKSSCWLHRLRSTLGHGGEDVNNSSGERGVQVCSLSVFFSHTHTPSVPVHSIFLLREFFFCFLLLFSATLE